MLHFLQELISLSCELAGENNRLFRSFATFFSQQRQLCPRGYGSSKTLIAPLTATTYDSSNCPTRRGGAHASQPSVSASRTGRFVAFFSWMRTAA